MRTAEARELLRNGNYDRTADQFDYPLLLSFCEFGTLRSVNAALEWTTTLK